MPLANALTVPPTEPFALNHSWPLFDRDTRLDLGLVRAAPPANFSAAGSAVTMTGMGTAGRWRCDLSDNHLTWSDAVYDLFGLPRGSPLDRDQTVRLYAEPSRAAMESLRAYAIRYRRGFTIDARIRPANGGTSRWMRLVAAPVLDGKRVVRLEGLKLDVSAAYR